MIILDIDLDLCISIMLENKFEFRLAAYFYKSIAGDFKIFTRMYVSRSGAPSPKSWVLESLFRLRRRIKKLLASG